VTSSVPVAATTTAQVSVLPTRAEAATTSVAEETGVAVAGVKTGGEGLAPTGSGPWQGPALAASLGLLLAGATLVALSARRTHRRRH
jgi:hypothetical protein